MAFTLTTVNLKRVGLLVLVISADHRHVTLTRLVSVGSSHLHAGIHRDLQPGVDVQMFFAGFSVFMCEKVIA